MKLSFFLFLILEFSISLASAQSKEFKLLTWNLKWFGDDNCNCDTSLQYQNVKTVLQVEAPDIVALQEIVNLTSIQKLAAEMNYHLEVAPYASLASDQNSTRYPAAQKLAFLYKSGINLITSYGLARTTYPLLSNTNSPYYYNASGRFPFLARFELADNSGKDTITLVNIHAKSGTSSTDYNRRKKAAGVMMDSLLLQYSGAKVVVLGDYNDLLAGSIFSTSSTSPYAGAITDGYTPWTHPDSLPGQTTYPAYSNSLIDNFMSSPDFSGRVVQGSVQIHADVSTYISNYTSTTSDHYPVSLKYMSDVYNVTETKTYQELSLKIYPNPAGGYVHIASDLEGVWNYELQEISGKVLEHGQTKLNNSDIEIEAVPAGMFILRLWSGNRSFSYSLVKML